MHHHHMREDGEMERPSVIIAEVAQAHDGSLGTAHAYIDAVARAGADSVKFQTHIAAAESTQAEPWRVHFSPQDDTRYDYWRRMEFTESQWAGLKAHTEEKGLLFLSSPFSIEAAQMLMRIGVRAWKVASGEVNNPLLLRMIKESKLPAFVSTGMSSFDEIERTVKSLQSEQVNFTLMQCTSIYPCPPEKVGLNLIEVFKRRFRCPVGLSDHSGKIYAGLAAATLGIAALEVHVTFSRECFGPDVPASLTTSELGQLVEGVRFIERMRRNPADKDELSSELEQMNRTFRKSVTAGRDLEAGETLESEVLALKKPGFGIPAERLPEVVGRKLRRAVAAGTQLCEDDLA